MKLAIISFARKDSQRLPKKNTMKLRGVPLIWYTMRTMNYLYLKLFTNGIECERYILTDYKECKDMALEKNIPVIWRNHPKEWDDNRLNVWAHEKIKADCYLLLQPTSPFRDDAKILQWVEICLNNNVESAFCVKHIGDNVFTRAGSFFYYTSKLLLEKNELNNSDSMIFQDNIDIDIDTKEDFERAERHIDEM